MPGDASLLLVGATSSSKRVTSGRLKVLDPSSKTDCAVSIDADKTDVNAINATTADSRLTVLQNARAVESTDEIIRVDKWVNIFSAPLGAIVADRSGGVISDAAIPFLNCLGGDYSCRREPRRFISFSDNIVLVRQIA